MGQEPQERAGAAEQGQVNDPLHAQAALTLDISLLCLLVEDRVVGESDAIAIDQSDARWVGVDLCGQI